MSDQSLLLSVQLRSIRMARGWTLAELSERTGLPESLLTRYERGTANPDAVHLDILCDAFGEDGNELIRLISRKSD